MAVSIRCKRFGRNKKAIYRVVVADRRNQRDGKTIEDIGYYDPSNKKSMFTIKKDRVEYWLSVGAIPTKVIQRLLAKEGMVEKKEVKSSNQKVAKKDRTKAEK
tara:strand:+ start:76 stop:384 length:309 start_codon:yes stop_codon:yes gene_type:complete